MRVFFNLLATAAERSTTAAERSATAATASARATNRPTKKGGLGCWVTFAVLLLGTIGVPSAQAQEQVSLEQAYALAVKSNPTIKMLKQRVVQAKASLSRAWTAVKPTFNLQGTFTHFDQEIVVDFAENSPVPMTGVEPIVIQKQNQFGFAANATLPLFRGPAYPAIGIAQKGVRAARLTEVRSRRDFLLQVAQAYYGVVSIKEVLVALKHKLQVDQKHLAAAKAQLAVGQAPRSTVLRAELVVTQDEQQLHAQRNTLAASRRQLGILLGVDGQVEVARPSEPQTPQGATAELTRQAMTDRKDLKAAKVSLEIAQDSRQAVWWRFLPALDFNWLYRWTEAAGFAPQNDSWNLTLTLSVPLYDGGVRYADLRETHSRIREAAAQKQVLEQQVQRDIVRLQAEVASANAGVVSARKAVELATTTESDMEASFQLGAATQLDVLDASQRLLDAQLQLTQSLYDRDLTRLALAHALGRFDPLRGNQ